MDCRDRRLLFVLVATTLAAASAVLLGMHSDVLLALPVVLFALPLLAGRYVGEERPGAARGGLRLTPSPVVSGSRLHGATLAARPAPRRHPHRGIPSSAPTAGRTAPRRLARPRPGSGEPGSARARRASR